MQQRTEYADMFSNNNNNNNVTVLCFIYIYVIRSVCPLLNVINNKKH